MTCELITNRSWMTAVGSMTLAAELFAKVARDLESALVRPSLPEEPEAYTVFCLSDPKCDGDVEPLACRPAGSRSPACSPICRPSA